MAEPLLMLALSPTMEEGTIVKWNVKEGDQVSSGDALCEVQTDKTTMEYESMAEGTLLKILVSEGEAAKVGEAIAIVGEAGEDIEALLTDHAKAGARSAPQQPAPPPEAPAEPPAPERPPGKRPKASPLARKLASQAGIDLAAVRPSGPGERIVKRDIEAFLKEQPPEVARPAPPPDEVIPVTEKRRIIAERLSGSKFSSPHYYLKVRAVLDTLLQTRSALNASRSERLTLNAFFVKLTAEALKRHRFVNATWRGNEIVLFGSVDIALAVAQPDGLIAPVVRDCGTKGIEQIDAEMKALIEKARRGTLAPNEYAGATFTITNLGSYGIEEFTAIINPPGSAILAVGAAQPAQVFSPDGTAQLKQVATLVLSCDHRVVDGAVGAAFLRDLKLMIEEPLRALL